MEAEHASLGPPSYSRDFDACMRQLEAIERSMQAQQDMTVSTLPRQSVKGTKGCNSAKRLQIIISSNL